MSNVPPAYINRPEQIHTLPFSGYLLLLHLVRITTVSGVMPEYVYALHDFLPENDDEVSFHAGERIEVIEKDDMYGDGWWHVCVLVLHSFRLLITVSTGP